METKTELTIRLKKLKDSQPVISTGVEYKGLSPKSQLCLRT